MGLLIFIGVMVAFWYLSFMAGAKQATESYSDYLKYKGLERDYIAWLGRKINGDQGGDAGRSRYKSHDFDDRSYRRTSVQTVDFVPKEHQNKTVCPACDKLFGKPSFIDLILFILFGKKL